MSWRVVVNLVPMTITQDAYGAQVPVDGPPREVMGQEKSVRSSEFYQAHAVGMKPETVFQIRRVEYQGEPKLTYEGVTYYIIRTYSKAGELLDLVCSRYPMGG